MTEELKKEYSRRISQANKTELVVILYEMFLIYVDTAKKRHAEEDKQGCQEEIRKARGCLKELMGSLNFDYEPAPQLLQLYIFVNKELVQADVHGNVESLDHVIAIIGELYEAFNEISNQDESSPVMENPQNVYAGLTYGKNNLTENIDVSQENRGFFA